MTLLDSDVLIDLFDRNTKRHEFTNRVIFDHIDFSKIVISCFSKFELIEGVRDKSHQKRLLKSTGLLYLLEIEKETFNLAFKLMKIYKLSHGMKTGDSIIAATALINKLELFTYNTKDFKFIPELKLFNFEKYQNN